MMRNAALVFSLFTACSTALSTTSLVAPLPNYSVFIPRWKVEVSPGGPFITLNGTIQQVREQLLQLNPNWDNDYLDIESEPGNNATIKKRTDFTGSGLICRQRWESASYSEIIQGIEHLKAVQGQPVNGAGWGNCGRVSCSEKSAIWWCNDDVKPKTLESFDSIAEGAKYIAVHCTGPEKKFTSGQAFHNTHWNVIVRFDRQDC